MYEFEFTVSDPAGMHARPAGRLAAECAKYNCIAEIEKDGQRAEVRRVIAVMALTIRQGDRVRISVVGEDEKAAGQALEAFCRENF